MTSLAPAHREDLVSAFVRANTPRFVSELQELIRFRSVSSDPALSTQLRGCARWLLLQLRRLGAHARLLPTPSHPVVLARFSAPSDKTVLVYGHYDVQPATPLEAWRSPAFEPQVRAGFVYGRGASDDKGQLFAHVKAVEALQHVYGQLPVNVVFLLEGEEEIGSPHLDQALAMLPELRDSAAAVVSDTPGVSARQPALVHALRGDLYLEIDVASPATDLHSGNFGGTIENAVRVLSTALARLYDAHGRVQVPGFYADIAGLPLHERRYMRRAGRSNRDVVHESGGGVLGGEPGFSAYERTTIRPSLEISGISGGYTGQGIKGVIPARAHAKLDIRLVPDQSPARVHKAVVEFLRAQLPRRFELRSRERMRIAPVTLDRNGPVFRAAKRAYERGFGATPRCLRLGGSIPVVSKLSQHLDIPTVLMGFALPDDGAHAPNERFSIAMLQAGIRTSAAFLEELGGSHR